MTRRVPRDPRTLIAAFTHEDAQLLRLAADSFAAPVIECTGEGCQFVKFPTMKGHTP